MLIIILCVFLHLVSSSNLSAKVDQYVDVLREASLHANVEADVRERLHCLLSSLITQNIHHRDIMDGKGHILCTALVMLALKTKVMWQ